MGLKLENVSLAIEGKTILDQLSVEAQDGDFICLLGPSGCGKTSTLRILSGLAQPDSGTVTLKERLVNDATTHVPPEKRRVGFLFQDFALFPHLSVRDNIAFGIADNREASTVVQEMLEAVNMSEYIDAMPHMLSGGQQQRIALARAMAPRPDVMLLDEPFSGLDTSLRLRLRTITHEILKKHNITTVMVTHDADEAMFMADKIVLMNEGQIVQMGSPSELYTKPESEFCASFFGEVHSFSGVVDQGMIKTAIGSFETNSHENGAEVRVLVRPESITVNPVPDVSFDTHTTFELTSLHYLGEKQLMRLRNVNDESGTDALAIRVNIQDGLKEGTKIKLKASQKDLLLYA